MRSYDPAVAHRAVDPIPNSETGPSCLCKSNPSLGYLLAPRWGTNNGGNIKKTSTASEHPDVVDRCAELPTTITGGVFLGIAVGSPNCMKNGMS